MYNINKQLAQIYTDRQIYFDFGYDFLKHFYSAFSSIVYFAKCHEILTLNY